MKLEFSKMHGLGNDFVVIDAISQSVDLCTVQVRALADRHTGIGCDQLLLVERARGSDADFRYRIFNADGGEVGQCGNGARCFMRFVHDQGLTDKTDIVVETRSGLLQLALEPDGQVTVVKLLLNNVLDSVSEENRTKLVQKFEEIRPTHNIRLFAEKDGHIQEVFIGNGNPQG